jgi:Ca2+-binding EF-hand superfamily protein
MRAFKYFDLDNSGAVDMKEFQQAMNKIGIQFSSNDEMWGIFRNYDTNGNQELEYKEFADILFQKSPEKKQKRAAADLLPQLREKLKSRGARGMIGLARSFKIMDDNNSKTLEPAEFAKALRDYGLGFSKEEIEQLYGLFDSNGDGSIDYDEFLRHVRGPMNERRRLIVLKAFNKLDRDHSGTLDFTDIKGVYNCTKHPDVASGKKSEDEVLQEFLQTFEVHHNTSTGGKPDSFVTKDEFIEYYNNISMSIDNDQYFELMMNTAWRLNDNPGYAGWSNGEPGSIAFKKAPRPSHPYPAEALVTASQDIGKAKGGFNFTVGTREIDMSVDKFRQKLIKRGVRGFVGL